MKKDQSYNNCFICGEPLQYLAQMEEMVCAYCSGSFLANARCMSGHYVCDTCHAKGALAAVRDFCLQSDSSDPVYLAEMLLKHPSVKMHGPEHHFLVPAVLLTAYANALGLREALRSQLEEAEKRAASVPGGFCGFYGCCGAAVGTGIFCSIATGATPLSQREWQWANLITARVLQRIAQNGGPRCCKRNTFLALEEASRFVAEHLGVKLDESSSFCCSYQAWNNECRGRDCLYFSSAKSN